MIEARHLKPEAKVLLPPAPARKRPQSLFELIAAIDASPFLQKIIARRAGFSHGLLTRWRNGQLEPRQANMDRVWQAMQELENGR